jgi:MFS family permease
VNGPLLAAVQAAVAPEMQGRVFSLINTMASGMSPIGLIIAGPISDKLGVQTWFIIGGVVTGLMGVISLFIPAIMHFEEGRVGVEAEKTEKSIETVIEKDEFGVERLPRTTGAEADFS